MAELSVEPRTQMRPLTTPRLTLRQLTVADITDAYVAGMNDPEVVRWTEARHTRWDRGRVAEFIERANTPGESVLVGIFLRPSGRHIGNMRLFDFHPRYRRAEFSLVIFDKSQWSQGYATEAVDALTSYAFDAFDLHRIHADYYAPNAGSAKMFANAGFGIEGIFRDHVAIDGEYVDSVRIAKLRPERAA